MFIMFLSTFVKFNLKNFWKIYSNIIIKICSFTSGGPSRLYRGCHFIPLLSDHKSSQSCWSRWRRDSLCLSPGCPSVKGLRKNFTHTYSFSYSCCEYGSCSFCLWLIVGNNVLFFFEKYYEIFIKSFEAFYLNQWFCSKYCW